MFEHILDCPQCGHRFHYEHDGDEFPADISCPQCGTASPSSSYYALVICNGCRSKLKIPLSMLGNSENACPKCGAEIQNDRLSQLTGTGTTIGDFVVVPEKKQMLQDGDFFDKYRIIRLLGRGGMAEVYLAEHLLLKQQCALKLMQHSLDQDNNPVFIKRFVREAKLTHSLSHPNIVKVFDAGSDFQTGHLFLAMEYVEGKTLHDILCESELSEHELLEILVSMSSALKEIENAKIVHRDIKPSNIMYTNEGVYKLMDLGIAKMESNHQAGDLTLTMEQSTIGTPGYASPEQCQAAHMVDIRSDIFSLGASMYHVATGQLPFEGDTPVAVILSTMQKDPVSLRELRPDLSGAFINLIEKMMKKKPSERFQNTDELIEAVEKVRSRAGESSPVVHLRRVFSEITTTMMFTLNTKIKPELLEKSKSACRLSLGVCSKALKLALTIILLAVIAVHAYYFYLRYHKEEPLNYMTYLQSLRDTVTGKKKGEPAPGTLHARAQGTPGTEEIYQWEKVKKHLNSLHPLIPLPDREMQPVKHGYKNIFLYTKVALQKPLSKKFLEERDFQSAHLSNFWGSRSEMFRQGLLDLSESRQIVSYSGVFRGAENWSVFLNFALDRTDASAIFTYNGAELFVYEGTVRLAYCGYYTDTGIKVKPGKWMNLTLSLNHPENRLDLVSGDLLLGSYLFSHQTYGNKLSTLRFHSAIIRQSFKGKIDYLAVSSQSLQLKPQQPLQRAALVTGSQRLPDRIIFESGSAPETLRTAARSLPVSQVTEKAKKLPAPSAVAATAPAATAPAATSSKGELIQWSYTHPGNNADLDQALKCSRENLERYRAAVKNVRARRNASVSHSQRDARNAIVDTAADILEGWEKRVETMTQRNKRILEAKNRQYSDTQTRRAALEVEELIKTWYQHRNDKAKLDAACRKTVAVLKNRNVDPNLKVRHLAWFTTYKNGKRESNFRYYESAPLLRYFHRNYSYATDFALLLQAVMNRYPDPQVLQPPVSYLSLLTKNFVKYGLPAKMLQQTMDLFFGAYRLSEDDLQHIAYLFMDGANLKKEYLFKALLMEKYDIVLFLLACGVDPNVRDSGGETAFHKTYLLTNGSKYRDLLLAAGADPALRSTRGKRPADLMGLAAVLEKWKTGDIEAVRKALKTGKITPDQVLPGCRSLLTLACQNGNVQQVEFLLSNGADPNLRDAAGMHPLLCRPSSPGEQQKSTENTVRIIQLLLDKGADINAPVSKGGYFGCLSSLLMTNRSRINVEELIPAIAHHLHKLDARQWSRLLMYFSASRSSSLSDQGKLMLFAKCPPRIMQSRFRFVFRQLHITPDFIKEYLSGDDPERFWITHNGWYEKTPLLLFLIRTRQSIEVIQAAIDAGAYNACRNWKNSVGRTLDQHIPSGLKEQLNLSR